MSSNGALKNNTRSETGFAAAIKDIWNFLTGHTARRLETASKKIIDNGGKKPNGKLTDMGFIADAEENRN